MSLLNLEELSSFNRRLVNLLIAEFWSIVLIKGQSIILVRVFSSLFMLIGLRQKGLTIVAGFVTHRFYGFRRFRTLVGFVVFFRSFVVSWFHRFRCVKGFVVTYVSCFHGFRGFNGFIGFMGFVVSKVSWFYEFCGFVGFVVSQVSWVSCFHGSHLFLFIRRNTFFMLKINTCTCQTQVERTNFYVAQKKERKKVFSMQQFQGEYFAR